MTVRLGQTVTALPRECRSHMEKHVASLEPKAAKNRCGDLLICSDCRSQVWVGGYLTLPWENTGYGGPEFCWAPVGYFKSLLCCLGTPPPPPHHGKASPPSLPGAQTVVPLLSKQGLGLAVLTRGQQTLQLLLMNCSMLSTQAAWEAKGKNCAFWTFPAPPTILESVLSMMSLFWELMAMGGVHILYRKKHCLAWH